MIKGARASKSAVSTTVRCAVWSRGQPRFEVSGPRSAVLGAAPETCQGILLVCLRADCSAPVESVTRTLKLAVASKT